MLVSAIFVANTTFHALFLEWAHKDLGLHVNREIHVNWAYDQFFDFVTKFLVSCFDFVPARQKYKDVAFWLRRVNLEDCCGDNSPRAEECNEGQQMPWNCAYIELMQYSYKR